METRNCTLFFRIDSDAFILAFFLHQNHNELDNKGQSQSEGRDDEQRQDSEYITYPIRIH